MSVESKGFAGALSGGAPVRHSRISGIGGYRPKRVVPNAEIVDLIDSLRLKQVDVLGYQTGALAAVELALARNTEGRDRRREIADRDVQRDVEREFKGRFRS